MHFQIKKKGSTSNILSPIPDLFLAFTVLIFNVSLVSAVWTAPGQLVPVKGELGYKQRGNRIEGFYEKSTGGNLHVVSLLYGVLRFDWNPGVVLEILPPAEMQRTIKVRARAIPLKTYYQMDGTIPPKEILTWPIKDVLYKAGLKANMIGVFGWFGSENEKKLVPLKIYQKGSPVSRPAINPLFFTARADVDVEKVICRFSEVVNGKNLKSAEGWKETGNYINAGHAIRIELPGRNSGELCVEIKAKQANNGWLSLKTFVFYGKTP